VEHSGPFEGHEIHATELDPQVRSLVSLAIQRVHHCHMTLADLQYLVKNDKTGTTSHHHGIAFRKIK
jgi:hypothetical protein